ncbi:DUF4240 domain-containing protein [Oceanivirga salmonicida]|uniref:DUF4240 domain-containing protein n=1 Tax=Oceanivirga salmonicida TaxID=1769291 RepID=UPI000836E9FA|nr:DUF4240 domain-containing protein [Oceanivirga salmonicida]
MKTGIEIKTNFFPLAFFLYLVTPVIEINGEKHKKKWGTTFFDLPAGKYKIKIYFKYMGMNECGSNEIIVSLLEGEHKKITYYMPTFMFMKGKIKEQKGKSIEKSLNLKNELLNEDTFWNIIELSLENTENIDEQKEFLISELGKMSIQETLGFKLRLNDLTNNIHTSQMWCAAYLMNGGCSDDGFDYFKNWVVSKGKDTYYRAKENPDSLSECFNQENEGEFEFESLDYVAVEVFEKKTGKSIYDYMPKASFNRNEFEFNWNEDDTESMKAICPKIFEKVGW